MTVFSFPFRLHNADHLSDFPHMASISWPRCYGTTDVTARRVAREERKRAHAIRDEENAVSTRLVQNARLETSRGKRWMSTTASAQQLLLWSMQFRLHSPLRRQEFFWIVRSLYANTRVLQSRHAKMPPKRCEIQAKEDPVYQEVSLHCCRTHSFKYLWKSRSCVEQRTLEQSMNCYKLHA